MPCVSSQTFFILRCEKHIQPSAAPMCRTAYCWVLAALPLFFGLSCAILNGDEETLETPLALTFAACGPADGPAFFVYLPEAASSCSDLEALTSTYPPR